MATGNPRKNKTPPTSGIHPFIHEHMLEAGISNEDMARRLGVVRETVYRWRMQERRPNPKALAALAKELGKTVEDLYRRPGRRSLDALSKDVDDATHDTIFDIVARLVTPKS